jgi:uncharacterized membrane protein YhaH (DUF805 family)
MRLRSLLFSFEGRINRAKYWYVSFASLCSYLFFYVFMAVLAWALGGFFAVKSVSVHIFPLMYFHVSFTYNSPASSAALLYPLFYAAETPFLVIGIWFLAATTIKRLHDRNKSGWWIVPFCVAPSLLYELMWLDAPLTVALIVSALGFGLALWGFVELSCLKGTRGPNRFGPDPLAPEAPTAPVQTQPRWDQHGELGFMPHRAGP